MGTRAVAKGPARLVTVWCPDWAAVAAGSGDGRPLAVLRGELVLARSASAAAAGVKPGMRRRQAQAVCTELAVADEDPARDQRLFEPVVRAVAELVPLLEVAAPGRLVFGARGPSRYHGGDEALAERLHALVRKVVPGVPVAVGVADGRFASAVAARTAFDHARRAAIERARRAGFDRARGRRPRSFDPPVPDWSAPDVPPSILVVPPGQEATAAFLAPYPVGVFAAAGGVDARLADLLARMGLRRVSDVAALPARDLLGRFGPAGEALHRLATGTDDLPPDATTPPPDLAVTHHFDAPVTELEIVAFVAKTLAADLIGALADRGLVCTRLIVEADTDHGEHTARSWYQRGGLTQAAMVDRVRWQLDGWINGKAGDGHGSRPSAGVVMVRLVPDQVRADQGEQAGFWGGRTRADQQAARAIARVVNLVGVDAVTVPEWRGSRQHQYLLVPAAGIDLTERVAHLTPQPDLGPWPGKLPSPSPTVIYPTPVAASVLDADGKLVGVSGRGEVSASPATVDGRRIQAWTGPWPVNERWWDANPRRAARFQLVIEQPEGHARAHLAEVVGDQWLLTAEY